MKWYVDPTTFTGENPLPGGFYDLAGPMGPALVHVYKDGRTTPGWGLTQKDGPGFLENYQRNKFWARSKLWAFKDSGTAFAIIMRSVNMVMIDIDRHIDDGGADGFVAARGIELPPTLAETSKSGEGRHLYYHSDDTWDDALGFARFDDMLAIAPGSDIRGVGCSYHYPSQRWLEHPIARLPRDLEDRINNRIVLKQAARSVLTTTAQNPDTEEALVMYDALLAELAKPIQVGTRNSSLFAIGAKMKAAGLPDWDTALYDRANELGLEADEAAKLVRNVERYAV